MYNPPRTLFSTYQIAGGTRNPGMKFLRALSGYPRVNPVARDQLTLDVIRDKLSIDDGDLRIVGPAGFQQFPEFVQKSGTGATIRATYRLVPPGSTWRTEHRGEFQIELKGFQVRDTSARFTPEETLGRFRID